MICLILSHFLHCCADIASVVITGYVIVIVEATPQGDRDVK